MSQVKFYHFKNIRYKPQPKNSNWCWAACLSNMINGLEAVSNIGNTQCDLVSYYKQYIKNENLEYRLYKDCCENVENINSVCNLGINENHIENIYKAGGFNAIEIEDLDKIYDYEWVKSTLIRNQSPLLLKIYINGSAHANLIIGFGETDNCKYLLFSDPIDSTGETYINIELVGDIFDINKIWETQVDDNTNIIEDTEIKERYRKAKEFVNFFDKEIGDLLKNPLNYLGYKNPTFVDDLLDSSMKRNSLNINDKQKLVKDFENQRMNEVCQRRIPKRPLSEGNIASLNYKNLKDPTEDMIHIIKNYDTRSYVQEYAIELNVTLIEPLDELFNTYQNTELNENISTFNYERSREILRKKSKLNFKDLNSINDKPIILVKPISYPSNYKLSNLPQRLKDFELSLTYLTKATFFNEKKQSMHV